MYERYDKALFENLKFKQLLTKTGPKDTPVANAGVFCCMELNLAKILSIKQLLI